MAVNIVLGRKLNINLISIKLVLVFSLLYFNGV